MALATKYANFDLATGLDDGSSEANAWQTWDSMAAAAAAGDHIYIKRTSARHNAGANKTFSVGGSDTQPLILEGYNSTIGDGDSGVGMANFFQFGSTSLQRKVDFTGHNVMLRYISFANGGSFSTNGISGENCHAHRCEWLQGTTGSANSSALNSSGQDNLFTSCRFENDCTNQACLLAGIAGSYLGCYFIAKNATGPYVIQASGSNSDGFIFSDCIVKGSGSGDAALGFRVFGSQGDDRRLVVNCSISDCATGIYFQDMKNSALGRNSVFSNAIARVDKGIDSDDATADAQYGVELLSNAINSITADYENLGEGPGLLPGQVSLTGDPWTDAVNDDYSLDATAGQGAACTDASSPKDVVGDGTDLNQADIGSIQDGS